MLPKQEFESSEVESFIRAGVILAREYAHFLALPASRNQGPQKMSVSTVSNAGEESMRRSIMSTMVLSQKIEVDKTAHMVV